MPEAMKAKMRAFTAGLTAKIQYINGNPAFSAGEKAEEINKLEGIPREDMYEFLNINFRTGPDLAESLRKYVSEDRPRGGPRVRGILKKVKK